jgi:hypothetical protein
MVDAIAPIVIDGDGLFAAFPTAASACSYVEAEDVNDGLFEAFDSEGRRLLFQTHGNLVWLEVPPDSRPDPAELERRLRGYFQSVAVDPVGVTDIKDATLPVMLDEMLRFQRGEDRETPRWSLRGILARSGRRWIVGGHRPEQSDELAD